MMNFNDEVFEVIRVHNSVDRSRINYKSDGFYGAFDSKVYAIDTAKNAVLVYDDCEYVVSPNGKSKEELGLYPRFVWVSLDAQCEHNGTVESLIHKKK